MVSAISSAGWPVSSRIRRTCSMGRRVPAAVSLWTQHTARMSCLASAASASRIKPRSTPRRQSAGTVFTRKPRVPHIFAQLSEKCPVSGISTRSPGESTFTNDASHAPWPEAVYMNRCCSVFSTRFSPSKHASYTARNAGSLKSMEARAVASSTLSGMLVGPGLAKNSLPRAIRRGEAGNSALPSMIRHPLDLCAGVSAVVRPAATPRFSTQPRCGCSRPRASGRSPC